VFSNTVLLSVERVRVEKIDIDDFVDEFDSQHDNRMIKSHCADFDMKFGRRLCRNHIVHWLFVWIFLLIYLKKCVFRLWQDNNKLTQGLKVSFW